MKRYVLNFVQITSNLKVLKNRTDQSLFCNEAVISQLMKTIIENSYTNVFEASQLLVSTAEDTAHFDELKLLKTAVNAIYIATERLYYKKKIVLFPFLTKNIKTKDNQKCIPAINVAIDESFRISKMIENLKAELLDAATNEHKDYQNVLSVFNSLEVAWWTLCTNTDKLFGTYVSYDHINA